MKFFNSALTLLVGLCLPLQGLMASECSGDKLGGLEESENFETIVEKCRLAIKLNDKDSRAWSTLGWAEICRGNVSEGTIDCSKALDLNSNNITARKFRAFGRFRLGDYRASLEDLNVSQVKNSELHDFKALVFCELEDYKSAFAELDTALGKNSEDAQTHRVKGWVFARLGKFSSAVEDYSCAIKIDPKNAYLFLDRAYAYGELGLYDKSLADLKIVRKLAPGDVVLPIVNQAWAYWKLGQEELGRTTLDYAERVPPDRNRVACDWQSIMSILDIDRRSVYSWSRAIEMNDGSMYAISSLFNRGWSYQRLGARDKSISDFSRILSLLPDSRRDWQASVYRKRAEIFQYFGNKNQAEHDMTKAQSLSTSRECQ